MNDSNKPTLTAVPDINDVHGNKDFEDVEPTSLADNPDQEEGVDYEVPEDQGPQNDNDQDVGRVVTVQDMIYTYAAHIKHLNKEYSIKPADSINLIGLVLNYNITRQQMGLTHAREE